jgi:glycosyltransferase involved in cell wall biosynthesis
LAPASGSLSAVLQVPLAVFRLARILRRERFDVVQTHIFTTMVIGRPAAWLADVPVRTAMIAGPFHLEAYTSRWIERSTWWMETMLIPSCESSRQLCLELGIPEESLAPIIPYSPDERNFDPANIEPANIRAEFGWPDDTPLVCLVAYFYAALSSSRWVPQDLVGRGVKGHEDLIRAAPIVLAEFPKAKFLFVGSGWGEAGEKHEQDMKELARGMNVNDSFAFAGYRADANKILREADVAVQASLSENLGGTIEALMMECPVVATRVGGMVDSVRDGETGVLVQPRNPDDLARGIIQMLRDPARARALGHAGREFMLERYTLSRTIEDLNQLYRSLLLRESSNRKFYDPLVSLFRLAIAVLTFGYLAFRLIVLDIGVFMYVPICVARFRTARRRLYKLAHSYYYRPRALFRFRSPFRKRGH